MLETWVAWAELQTVAVEDSEARRDELRELKAPWLVLVSVAARLEMLVAVDALTASMDAESACAVVEVEELRECRLAVVESARDWRFTTAADVTSPRVSRRDTLAAMAVLREMVAPEIRESRVEDMREALAARADTLELRSDSRVRTALLVSAANRKNSVTCPPFFQRR